MKLLRCYDFSKRWINWVHQCVLTVSYLILLNGNTFEMFQSGQGVRQGNSLSPFLFILCYEVISRLLAQSLNLGVIHGVSIARGAPFVSHLMFADDLILFCLANYLEASEIVDIMQRYCAWSGQAINFQKSFMAFSESIHPQLKVAILFELNLKEMRTGSSYLTYHFFYHSPRGSPSLKLKIKLLSG